MCGLKMANLVLQIQCLVDVSVEGVGIFRHLNAPSGSEGSAAIYERLTGTQSTEELGCSFAGSCIFYRDVFVEEVLAHQGISVSPSLA